MTSQKNLMQVVALAVVVTIVLTLLVIVSWSRAASESGQIVIPAGNTYLGPNAPTRQQTGLGTFTTSGDTPWHDVKGTKYPYVLSVPTTLTLVVPEGDNPYDLLQISWGGYDPASTVLVGVDYTVDPKQTKLDYVRGWWKQFGGLKGVDTIDPFTNETGLKGYKARYVNGAGETPNLDVFFEVPGRPDLMIHLANGILDPDIFDRIVESVSWDPS